MESVSSQILRRMEEERIGLDVASKPDFTVIDSHRRYHTVRIQIAGVDYAQMESRVIADWRTRKNKSKAEVLKSLLIFKNLGD